VVGGVGTKEAYMYPEEFHKCRKKLQKTQKELAQLLGISMKAVCSYEQGWREIPLHTERQIFYLLSNRRGKKKCVSSCWEIKNCEVKEQCPAWEFQSGNLCWFLAGTLCDCTKGYSLDEKAERCRQCEILKNRLE